MASDIIPADAKQPHWATIEAEYRAGVKSLRQIAEEHGISEGAIRKRSKRDDWARDLTARIQAKADAMVRKEAVRNEVRSASAISEKEIVEANATAIVQVRIGHRKDISRGRSLVMSLLAELEHQAGAENVALLEELGDLLRKPDDKGQDKLNDLYQKVISLPGRAKTMKDLGDTLRTIVTLERQAFGLDTEAPQKDDGLAALATTEIRRLRAQLSDEAAT